MKVEVKDGGDVAQASSQDAKADEGQGVTEMCNLSGIKFKPKEENSLQMALLFVCARMMGIINPIKLVGDIGSKERSAIGDVQTGGVGAVQLVVHVLDAEVGPVVGDHRHHLHHQGHHCVH